MVVTHQPIAVNRPQDEHNLLHGREHAARRWSAAGADLVLGGHIHLPYVAALHEQMPDLPRPLWAIQAGTALSRRIRHQADNSFNLIAYESGASGGAAARHAFVERWDYVPAVERFELADGKDLGLGVRGGEVGHCTSKSISPRSATTKAPTRLESGVTRRAHA